MSGRVDFPANLQTEEYNHKTMQIFGSFKQIFFYSSFNCISLKADQLQVSTNAVFDFQHVVVSA